MKMDLGRGKAWLFDGILDVDWDLISYHTGFDVVRKLGPSAARKDIAKELAKYLLVNVDPDFPKKVQPGDYIIGGKGLGYGHAHSYSIVAMQGAGISALLCEAPLTSFKRDCIHHRFPMVGIKGIMAVTKQGDELDVDLGAGVVKNLTSKKELRFQPYPDFLIKMLQAGGLQHLHSFGDW